MKTLILKLLALTIFSLIVFTACKKDSSLGPQPTIVKGSIDQSLTSGTWRIGSFIDNGVNKTGNYTDFGLQFNTNGIVTATSSSTVFTGSWSTSNKNDHIQLMLNFINQGAFTELTHNWTVAQTDITQIKFADTDNGNTDYLTLSKNLIK